MNLVDKKGNNFEFLIETLDDLWVLSQFIVPEDIIYATTERKIKIGTETNYKVVKKLIFVNLLVKQANFENDVLRISGQIQNETEFTKIGAFHSLNFKCSDKIKIEKKELLKYEKKLIDNAINSKKSHNLLVLLDKDELVTAEFSDFSYKILFEKKGLGSKKYANIEIDENEEKFKIIEDLLNKNYSNILLSGPGIFKDKLQKYIKDKIGIKTTTFHYNDVNAINVPKVIQKVQKEGILSDSQLAFESKYISILLENINKGSKFTYGKDNTFNCVNMGSIDVFLVSTKFIENAKENNNYKEINDIMKLVENLNGKLVIVNSKNESGKILDGLGGIGGILRY